MNYNLNINISVDAQKKFYNNTDKQMLNEFLNRIREGVFDIHINAELHNKYNDISNITVKTSIVPDNKKINFIPTSISIYSNFINKNKQYVPKEEKSHVTFHLTENNFDNNKAGPLHLKVYDISKNAIYFLLVPYYDKFLDQLIFIYSNVKFDNYDINKLQLNYPEYFIYLDILNMYYNKDHPFYLKKQLTKRLLHNNYLFRHINIITNKTNHKLKHSSNRLKFKDKFKTRKILLSPKKLFKKTFRKLNTNLSTKPKIKILNNKKTIKNKIKKGFNLLTLSNSNNE